jgi:hypothetical protein
MQRRITILVLVTAFLMVVSPGAFALRTVHIDLPEAYLLDGPGIGYGIICKITQNEPLALVSWEGDWFQVRRSNGMTGWLSRVALTPDDSARYPNGGGIGGPGTPNAGKTDSAGGSFLDSIRTGFTGGRDDTLTASAGGRGITTETRPGTYSQDYRAVHYMESIIISDAELHWFIVSGGLRP